MPNPPLVSIITPTRNQGQFLEATLRSVRDQTYSNIEHIVIDGGSTDQTLEILGREADGGRLRFITGRDTGMYDAINKGLDLATGDVLGYINSDDIYFPWAVDATMRVFASKPSVDVVFGDGLKVDEETGVQRLRLFPPFDRVSLANYESLMQPAVFWRRRVFEKMGGFDTNLRYVADLDYWLRASEAGLRIQHVNEVLAIERIHAERLSTSRKDAMAAEDRAMRARHAGDRGGPEGRAKAVARDIRWQRWLWRRFVVAAFARRFPLLRRLPSPWRQFLRRGQVGVKWKRALEGSQPHHYNMLKNAVRSNMAATLVAAQPTAQPHGHGLVERVLPDVVAAGAATGHLIEVGTTREKLPGQASTAVLAALAAQLEVPFVTVDMDPANTERARVDLAAFPGARAETARGEDYLTAFGEPILAAYLDAFDIQHGEHSAARVESYRRYLGKEITNEGSSAMHLACAQALIPRLVPGGLVVIDDTWTEDAGWGGKGSTAVPALLAADFRIVARTKRAVALQAPGGGQLPDEAPAAPAVAKMGPDKRRASLPRRLVRRSRRLYRRIATDFRYRRGEATIRWTYRLSAEGRRSRAKLRELRGSGSGRCVIIGNGPSLNSMDLSVLAGVPAFALNRGHLLFPRIGAATPYLASVNRHVLEQSAGEMLATPSIKFFNWRHRRFVPEGRDDVVFVQTVHEPGFSTDVAAGLWEGTTVTFVAMQLAMHLGYRDIVLIGVDHSFTTPGPAHQLVTSSGADPNHFDPNYFGKGYRWQLPDLDTSEVAYRIAKAAFEAAGGSVIDATVGGKLTVYPKAQFTELFPPAERGVNAG